MKLNRCLLAALAVLGLVFCFQGVASAQALVQFNNPDAGPPCANGTSSAQASFVSPAVTASDWTLTRTGGGCDNAASFSGLGGAGNATFSFGLTANTGITLTDVSFHESNNDCQAGGPPRCTTGANWDVTETINGGTSTDLGTFISGAPFTDFVFSFTLSNALNAGDKVQFSVVNTTGPVIGTANYGIYTGEIDGVTPEPGTLLLLGSALVVIAVTRIRKRIAG